MSEKSPESGNVVTQQMPFLLVMSVYFFSGSVFLIFNVPVLAHVVESEKYLNLGHLLHTGLVEFWTRIFKGASDGVLLGTPLFLGLVLGLLLSPVEKLLAHVCVWVAQRIGSRLPPPISTRAALLFSSQKFADQRYPAFLAWLISNRQAKVQWEWELFLYLLHWCVCTNVLVFVVASSVVLWDGATIQSIVLIGGPVAVYTGMALT